jgi:hypothetical protein
MKLQIRLNFLCILALVLACAGATNALAAEVFTWTDQDGIVHFSDMPSDAGESQKINVQEVYKPGTVEPPVPLSESQPEAGETPQSAAQQRRERIARERDERREVQAETEQLCSRRRQRLTQMEPARRVFYTDESGESVRMDDNKRMELIKEDKDYIAKNCE